MIKFYGYKKCGTCRKAEQALESFHIKYEFIDITLNPPSAKVLLALMTKGQHDLNKFFNTSGELYREMRIKDKLKGLSPEEAANLLSKHGKLIKRPLVFDQDRSSIGFKEPDFQNVWK